MDIYELLGEDPDAPGHKHARSLVAADHALVRDLVAVRDRSGMTQADVARTMGTSQASVSRFESGHSDAHLSTVRRYAKAVGALIRHDPELLSQLRAQGYRPRVHYLPPSAVQVLLEHLGTPEEFYEILRKA